MFGKKTTVLFFCIHKLVKSIVFAVSIKLCDESGLAILSNAFKFCRKYKTTNVLSIVNI